MIGEVDKAGMEAFVSKLREAFDDKDMDTAARYFELYDEAALAHDVAAESEEEELAAKGEPQL